MTVLAVAGLVAGSFALLRYVVGMGFLLRYLRRARVAAIPKGETPPISLLKPLYGADPGLAENLEATLRQNYPEFEVLFLHERPDDPALAAVERARELVPDVPVRLVAGRDPDATNPKVAVLMRGEREARHDILVSADSDVRPDPLYLRDVANGLAEADVVSFVPVAFGMRGLWARAAGLLFNADGILASIMLEGRAVTGATIGVRRSALERIGGYRAVADCIADDYSLGVALQKAGCRPALARRAARLYMPGGDFSHTAGWVLRWARIISHLVPGAFLLATLLALVPLLLIATALLTPWTAAALWLLAGITLLRALIAVMIDLRFCWDRSLVRALPLLPLLWLLEPCVMVAGWFGRTVRWRGRRYRMQGGRATLVDA